jgi:hypothetical protein
MPLRRLRSNLEILKQDKAWFFNLPVGRKYMICIPTRNPNPVTFLVQSGVGLNSGVSQY